MSNEKKLCDVLQDYSEWVRDARGGKFSGIDINTMSADDLLAIIGFMNHLLHNIRDREKAMENNSRILLPPGFRPKKPGMN